MTPTTVPYEALFRFNETGALAGAHYQERTIYRDESSGEKLAERLLDPRPVSEAGARLSEVAAAINAASLATVESLTTQLAAKTQEAADQEAAAAAAAAQVATLQAQLDAANARIAELSAPPSPAPESDLLAALHDKFAEVLTPEQQTAFAMPYAMVRVLIQAGQSAMAHAVIAQTPVPADLAAAKAELLALFPS